MTTSEIAAYLRLKERTVYDMVARQQIPCSRATGKLLFSKPLIDAWVESHTEMPPGRQFSSPQIYAGSSDPLLEWALRQSGSGIAVLTGGSQRGLEQIAAGDVLLAGLHLYDTESGSYNIPQVMTSIPHSDVVVIHWASRVQGLILPPENPLAIRSIADVVARRLRVARRPQGAGSQVLLETLLMREGLSEEDVNLTGRVAETETDLAGMVSMNEADCALGISAVARGQAFLPLWPDEQFDLILRRRDYFESPFQDLLALTRTEAFAQHTEYLGGYDTSRLGKVRYNA